MAVASRQGESRLSAGGGSSCPIFPGDAVEIYGLASETGRQLNGCKGVVGKKIPGTDRFEVRVGVDKRVNVKAESLRLVQDSPCEEVGKLGFGEADRAAAEEKEELINQAMGKFGFEPYEDVEIHGLASEAGIELNGKTGTIITVADGGQRLEVRIVLEQHHNGKVKRTKTVNLKPDNLRKPDQKASAPEPAGHVNLGVDPRRDSSPSNTSLPVQPGEIVEVSGLTSEAGKSLNGQKGVVTSCSEAEGRAEVQLAKSLKKLKFENLVKMDWAGGDRVLVEVIGLTSESGKQNNGQRGFIRDRDLETGRYDVRISKDKILKLKPENLRLIINEA